MEDTPFTLAQGMFADFVAVIGAIHYGKINGAAGIYVDYTNEWYVDRKYGPNWFDYFFEPSIILNPSLVNPEEVHFNSWVARYGKIGSFSQVVKNQDVLPSNDDNKMDKMFQDFPYPVNGNIGLDKVRSIVYNHIKIKQRVSNKVDKILEMNNIDQNIFLIGLHYRGTDKINVFPYERPPMSYYKYYVNQILKKYQPKQYRIFVATDSSDFIEYVEKIWPNDEAFYLKNNPRLSDYDITARTFYKGGLHKSSSFTPYEKAESAMLDMLLLSKCNYLIKNRSSLSDTSLAFNKDLKYILFFTPSYPVFSTDYEFDQPPDNLEM